ncbi:MAG: RsmE family RNA methyltransferase [Rikenellaceae bacterium]
MNLFFAEELSSQVILSSEESRHTVSVLRMRVGDCVMVTDGRGTMCWGEISVAEPKRVVIDVQRRVEDYQRRDYTLWMGVAPTKNIDRYEWFLEKATEVGVDRITPLLCDHSERRVVKRERSEKVVIGAVKQSQKAYLPSVDELTRFSDYLSEVVSVAGSRQLFIAHCDDLREKVELKDVLVGGGDYVVLIGPEGDFSPSEVSLAHSHGFRSVSLGASRLRTETAALYSVVCASLRN